MAPVKGGQFLALVLARLVCRARLLVGSMLLERVLAAPDGFILILLLRLLQPSQIVLLIPGIRTPVP